MTKRRYDCESDDKSKHAANPTEPFKSPSAERNPDCGVGDEEYQFEDGQARFSYGSHLNLSVSPLQHHQRLASDFQRPVNVRFRVRGADGALLAWQREMVDAAFNKRAAVAFVEVKIVA